MSSPRTGADDFTKIRDFASGIESQLLVDVVDDAEDAIRLLRVVRDEAIKKDALSATLYRDVCAWLGEFPDVNILARLYRAEEAEGVKL